MLKNTNIVRLTNGLQTDAIEGFKKNLEPPIFHCKLIEMMLDISMLEGHYLTILCLLILITSSMLGMDEMTEKYLSGQVVEFVDSYLNF